MIMRFALFAAVSVCVLCASLAEAGGCHVQQQQVVQQQVVRQVVTYQPVQQQVVQQQVYAQPQFVQQVQPQFVQQVQPVVNGGGFGAGFALGATAGLLRPPVVVGSPFVGARSVVATPRRFVIRR
jgi:hypothetical protein